MNYNLLNGANLAYVGDAYYELMVRKHLLEKGITKNKDLRKISINYVSAENHKKIYDKINDRFTQEEKDIFLRGRNSAPNGHRKNVDRSAYVVSSGLEAIIGYLYLKNDQTRLDEIIALMFKAVEGE
jgi:ribonuclease-3 family protein